nr:hypothetical protein [Parachlamydiaceae bacterium]
VYNDDAILSKYTETMKDCAAIKGILDNLLLKIDLGKTFPKASEKEIQEKENTFRNNTILPVQRMPRHVMFLEDLVKTNSLAMGLSKEDEDKGGAAKTLQKVKESALYLNVESGILIDKSTLEQVTKTLNEVIENTRDAKKKSILSSFSPSPSQSSLKKYDINKILDDIKNVSKSQDPSVQKTAKGLLSTLESSSGVMASIRDQEPLMKTFRELTSNTFKDIDTLKNLLIQKSEFKDKEFDIDENGNLILKNKTAVKSDEADTAKAKIEDIFEKAETNTARLLKKNDEDLRLSKKDSPSQKRYLAEQLLLLQTLSTVRNVDATLGFSLRKQNNVLIENLNKAIEDIRKGSEVVFGENGNYTVTPQTENNIADIKPMTPKVLEKMIDHLEVLLKSKDQETRAKAGNLLNNFQTYVIAQDNLENINWSSRGSVNSLINLFENVDNVGLGNKKDSSPLYQRFLKLVNENT